MYRKKLLLILFVPMIVGAEIDSSKGFPVMDLTLHNDLLILEACCDNGTGCCIDFSNSKSINDFENKVKSVNTYRDSELNSRMTTIRIKQRLNQTERRYNNRFNEIGKYYTR
jgi:hypothetical protein